MQKSKLSLDVYEHRERERGRGQHQELKMQRSPRSASQPEVPYMEANPELWVQLGEESRQANTAPLEIVQQL